MPVGLRQVGGWVAAIGAIALVFGALAYRPDPTPPAASAPAESPSTVPVAGGPAQEAVGDDLTVPPAPPRATPTPQPTPEPTAPPTPQPTAPPAPPAPPTPAPTDLAGGPIGPLRTAPPDWVPPIYGQDDVLVPAAFGQQASAGNITVRVTSLGVVPAGPNDGCPGPGDGEIRAYEMTVSWSGFALDFPLMGNGTSGQEWGWCAQPGEFVSGGTYTIWMWRAPGVTALDLYFFPDGFSPAYVFQYR